MCGLYIHIYIYILYTHTHTHTHTCIFIQGTTHEGAAVWGNGVQVHSTRTQQYSQDDTHCDAAKQRSPKLNRTISPSIVPALAPVIILCMCVCMSISLSIYLSHTHTHTQSHTHTHTHTHNSHAQHNTHTHRHLRAAEQASPPQPRDQTDLRGWPTNSTQWPCCPCPRRRHLVHMPS